MFAVFTVLVYERLSVKYSLPSKFNARRLSPMIAD